MENKEYLYKLISDELEPKVVRLNDLKYELSRQGSPHEYTNGYLDGILVALEVCEKILMK